ncbi:MAG TPA: M28 family peptidase [Ktedonobacterales bacterium]
MMRQRFMWRLFAALFLAALVSPLAASVAPGAGASVAAAPLVAARTASPPVGFPTVDPAYIYDQLFYMATHFQRREAGYDNNLPVTVNGHDEFATYWQAEMLRDLQGFGAQARRDPLKVDGWTGRPATVNAFNVEVTVPGQTHAEQMVVIGCHYDGEGSSTQSANDDASGCAIELGVARALATYWRANHLVPTRTLRFVIYDAEEQGLFGSFHYLNQTINGDIGNVTAMINEEQNGIGYPLRFLGKASNPLLPTTLFVTPLTNNQVYQNTQSLTDAQRQAITSFRTLMGQAAPAAFAAFRALGYGSLTYRDDQNHTVTQQIFTPQDLSDTPLQDDTIASSDQYPFSLAGTPTATFIGNYSYYDQNPVAWSYPYDQPQDTIQLMNVFASGSEAEAKALELSLALPGMLTTWTLAQPSVLGFTSADGKPLASIGDVATTQPGQPVTLDASAAYDPTQPGAALHYAWSFGDGARAEGVTTQHAWASAGDYPLKLTVSDATGTRSITKMVHVTGFPLVIENPYKAYPENGVPPSNPAVTLPQPEANVAPAAPTSPGSAPTSGAPWWLWVALAIVAILAVGGGIGFGVWRTRPAVGASGASAEADTERRRREQAVRELLTPRAPDDHPSDGGE